MNASTISKPITTLSLSDLRQTFGLVRDRNDPFFQQWLLESDDLSEFEHQALDRLKQNYSNIIETNPLEEVVKLVVVAPLLDLAGFYQPPFSIRAEASTTLEVSDQAQTFTGKIDVLVVQNKFWVLIVESKQARFDVSSGIPQALSYLLSQSTETQMSVDRYRFAMVTNGREVVFLRLLAEPSPTYSQSSVYQVIDVDQDLSEILKGLKWIGQYSL
ncbi:MAG: type I restriction endonuclease [Cyanobacteria bacterium P01_D01_bin.44]